MSTEEAQEQRNIIADESAARAIVKKKEKELYFDGVETSYENMIKRKEEIEKAQSIDLSKKNPEWIKSLKDNSTGYLQRAKNSGVFINDHFRGVVPYFGRNLVLVAGLSGDGKSTTCANIAFQDVIQGKKVLVISNEENASDVYNRVTCLIKGWAYKDHDKFSPAQHAVFEEYIDKLSQDNRMMVVDDSYGGEIGQTSTIEGMEYLLGSLLTKGVFYDSIIIDYYQNVDRSNKDPSLSTWQVQERFAKYLDKFKNTCEAPIIILAQLMEMGGEGKAFKERIEGRKIIYNSSTCAIEVRAERDSLRTSWQVHKSRFNDAVGKTVRTGYDRGMYVPYTTEFQSNVLALKESRERQKVLGLGDIELTGKNEKDD